MALPYQGTPSLDGSAFIVTVKGDGSTTTCAVTLAAACFRLIGTSPTQLATTTGTAHVVPGPGLADYVYTTAFSITTGVVTITFTAVSPAPAAIPTGLVTKPIVIGMMYP
jgi:hypothetical protein